MSVRKICKAKGCRFGDHRCAHAWWLDVSCGYVAHTFRAGPARRKRYLHREIIGATSGELVDHVNGDPPVTPLS